MPVVLGGLKRLNDSGEEFVDITAIVTVTDNGGSTGMLRRAFGMPAMGDIRNCLVSLSSAGGILSSVCQHRFEIIDGLAGHSVGNLILSALYQMFGDFETAVGKASELFSIQGRILPATEVRLTLCAVYEDGTTAEGESNIPRLDSRLSRVWVEPRNPFPARGVLGALEQADAIVIGPGSLYTSIIPNILVAGVADAIQSSRAMKIYVCNLMTEPGETNGYSAADHLRTLQSYLPPRSIDVCVLNTNTIGTGLATLYLSSGSEMVSGKPESEEEIRRMGVVPVPASLVKDSGVKARHDAVTLARLIVSLVRGVSDVPVMIHG